MVHDIMDLRPEHPWGPESRQSRIVLIGRNLDRPKLDREIRACFSEAA